MNPWNWLGSTPHDYFLSATTSVGTLILLWTAWLQHQQWRAAGQRPTPVFEIYRQADTPWPGWDNLTLVVRNCGPAAIGVTSISVGHFSNARIIRRSEVECSDGLTSDALPVLPPEVEGHSALSFGITAPPTAKDGTTRLRRTILLKRGTPTKAVKVTLTLRWHWHDQPKRHRTQRIYI